MSQLIQEQTQAVVEGVVEMVDVSGNVSVIFSPWKIGRTRGRGAGNGGHRQGEPTAHRASSRPCANSRCPITGSRHICEA